MRVHRAEHLARLRRLLKESPVVAILGGRQVGKTTLARDLAAGWRGPATFFDLEDPLDLARLADPGLALRGLRGLVVLDEIQRRPDLFPILRVLVDRPRTPARFLVLGSAAPHLLRQSSESLAGRIAFHELAGFSLAELPSGGFERRWLRGGLPRSFLARSEAESRRWRRNFVRTFLERDLAQFGAAVPTELLGRLWSMLSHAHGQILNSSELGRSLAVADTTVRRYLDLLAGTFAVRLLPPWFENLNKRQVRSPKVYVADCGLMHTLLGIEDRLGLDRHPKVGASFEGFALETIVDRLGARRDECFFWATQAGAELDLLVVRGRRRLGFEFKLTAAPSVTRSMTAALDSLALDRLDVVHAGDATFPLAKRVRALALSRAQTDLEALGE